jgi:8-oxo-dGTP diphosphatase
MSQPAKRINAAIAIVVRADGKILLCQRKADDHLGGYWEFPGGKVEAGETLEEALSRELLEELDIEARPLRPLASIDHDYTDVIVRLHPFLCRHIAREPRLIECQQAIWINPRDLRDYRLPPANDTLIEEVIEHFARSSTDRRNAQMG